MFSFTFPLRYRRLKCELQAQGSAVGTNHRIDPHDTVQVIGAFGLHMVATYERPLEELKSKGSKVVKYLRAKAGSLLVDYAGPA